MTQLLVQGSTILAHGPFVETTDEIQSDDAIYPKHVIDGWQIVDVSLPGDFTCSGYTWDGTQVVKKPPVVVPPVVPQQVTMRQARLALLAAGKLSSVDAAIAALSSPQKEEAQIEWEYSSMVDRNRPFVSMLAPALSLTDSDIDQLFITAATL